MWLQEAYCSALAFLVFYQNKTGNAAPVQAVAGTTAKKKQAGKHDYPRRF